MVIGTALGWSAVATIILAVVLAFFFGYLLTSIPLLRSGIALSTVIPIAFASDTASITIMEIVDNLIMLVIPGAMNAGLNSLFFWASLVVALAIAYVAAFPINRYLIARGRGHAVVHAHYGHH
jgi:DNA-binding FrmR family transcriptional regulator